MIVLGWTVAGEVAPAPCRVADGAPVSTVLAPVEHAATARLRLALQVGCADVMAVFLPSPPAGALRQARSGPPADAAELMALLRGAAQISVLLDCAGTGCPVTAADGRTWLRRRADDDRRAEATRGFAERVRSHLTVIGARAAALTRRGTSVRVDALVARDLFPPIGQAVAAAIERLHPPEGLSVTVTGPWPALSLSARAMAP